MNRRSFLKSGFLGAAGFLIGANKLRDKTVYFYSDYHTDNQSGPMHQSSQEDFALIRNFCNKNNIQTIAIEGWSGNVVDAKRGYLLLNGDEKLIRKLWDTNFTVVGLENDKLQVQILQLVILSFIMRNRNYLAAIYQRLLKRTDVIDKTKLQKMIHDLESSPYYISNETQINIWAKEQNLPVEHEHLIDIIHRLLPFERKLYDSYTNPKIWENFTNKFQKEIKQLMNRYHVAREEFATQKIASLTDEKIVMIFGAGHKDSLIRKLKEKGVIVIDM